VIVNTRLRQIAPPRRKFLSSTKLIKLEPWKPPTIMS